MDNFSTGYKNDNVTPSFPEATDVIQAQQNDVMWSNPPRPRRTVQTVCAGESRAALCTPVSLVTPSSVPRPPPILCNTPPAAISAPQVGRFSPLKLTAPSKSPLRYNAVDTISIQGGSDSLEGLLVEKALQDMMTLPQAVTEVASKTKGQTEELSKQRQLLKQLQEKLTSEKEKRDNLSTERASIKRRTYLAEESTLSKVESCKILQSELEEITVRQERLQAEMAELGERIAEDKQLYGNYLVKMASHEQLVSEQERERPLRVELNLLQEAVHRLEARERHLAADEAASRRLLEGHLEGELQEEMRHLEERRATTEADTSRYKGLLRKEKEKQQKIRTDIDVLCKRNTAQLTRLRAQVKEVQVRNRHWSERASHLEQAIADLQRQLVS